MYHKTTPLVGVSIEPELYAIYLLVCSYLSTIDCLFIIPNSHHSDTSILIQFCLKRAKKEKLIFTQWKDFDNGITIINKSACQNITHNTSKHIKQESRKIKDVYIYIKKIITPIKHCESRSIDVTQ